MRFTDAPLRARLIRRYQRFFADVRLADGQILTAHCPNTGGLLGCREPESPVWLRDSQDPTRKLRFTWQAVRTGGAWVNVDTSLPNRVVFEALERQLVPELAGYPERKREVRVGRDSRLDIAMSGPEGRCFIEVKSTTYRQGDSALFPDAVTERGRKHLELLTRLARRGERAVQFFFVNRSDVEGFRPADGIDPEYGRALRRAARAGVEILAWSARVEPRRLELGSPLSIELPPLRTRIAVPRRPALADSPWMVYVLVSGTTRGTYVGVTSDLDRRVEQHNGAAPGGARSTRKGRPWKIGATYGPFATRGEAQRVEHAVKRLRGPQRLHWRSAQVVKRPRRQRLREARTSAQPLEGTGTAASSSATHSTSARR